MSDRCRYCDHRAVEGSLCEQHNLLRRWVYRVPPPPAAATSARPGSEAKIAEMAARAARGEQLFHPDDPSLTNLRKKKEAKQHDAPHTTD